MAEAGARDLGAAVGLREAAEANRCEAVYTVHGFEQHWLIGMGSTKTEVPHTLMTLQLITKKTGKFPK
ncbi:hypothetical protein AV530_009148 [Patagioenas fasciata monilis]|uniref:Uncharacterized protein n=1 Tax=Patagioenas fasciata monilis TaxID=372326 RepID=A0A1V4IWB4_PATFA|nr:hypothetical protein AV530_009148 [Patagioenas fasciata monilis]